MDPSQASSHQAHAALLAACQAAPEAPTPPPPGVGPEDWAHWRRILLELPRLRLALAAWLEGQGPWPTALAWHAPSLAECLACWWPEACPWQPDPQRFVRPFGPAKPAPKAPSPKAFEPGPTGRLWVGALALEALGGEQQLRAYLEAWRRGHARRHGRLPAPLWVVAQAAWREQEVEWRWGDRLGGSLGLERESVALLAPPGWDLEALPGGVPGVGPGGRPMMWRPQEEAAAWRQAGWWVFRPLPLLGAWLEGLALAGSLPTEARPARLDGPAWGQSPPPSGPPESGSWGQLEGPASSPLDRRRLHFEAALACLDAPLDDGLELLGLGLALPRGPHPAWLEAQSQAPRPFDQRFRSLMLQAGLGPSLEVDPMWEALRALPGLSWRRLAPLAAEGGGRLEIRVPDPKTEARLLEALEPLVASGRWKGAWQGEEVRRLKLAIHQDLKLGGSPLLWAPLGWRPFLGPLTKHLEPKAIWVSQEEVPLGVQITVVGTWGWPD